MVSMGPRLYGQYGAMSVWSVWGHVIKKNIYISLFVIPSTDSPEDQIPKNRMFKFGSGLVQHI
jgi:hypothetical protein